jgi:hypothetical protein
VLVCVDCGADVDYFEKAGGLCRLGGRGPEDEVVVLCPDRSQRERLM